MRKLWTLSICFHPFYPLCQQSSLLIHFHSIYSILCEWETFQLNKGKDRCWRHYCIWKSFNKGPFNFGLYLFFLLPLPQYTALSLCGNSYWLSGEEGEIEIWHLAAHKRRVLFDESATGYDITPPRLYRFARSHRQQLSSSGVNEYGYSVSGYKERSMALAAQIQKWTLDIVTKWCFSRTQTSSSEFVQHFSYYRPFIH